MWFVYPYHTNNKFRATVVHPCIVRFKLVSTVLSNVYSQKRKYLHITADADRL
jgi:hypothetical protein